MRQIKFSNRSWLGLLLSLTMLLASCQFTTPGSQIQIPTDSPNSPSTGTDPVVRVEDQFSDGKSVIVREVISQGPAWIVIHKQKADGSVGDAIGFAAVLDGINSNVVVQIDPNQATAVMYAMLHKDAGKIGVYEFPGEDVPVFVKGAMVTPPFNWAKSTSSGLTPTVMAEQDMQTGVMTQTPDLGSVTENPTAASATQTAEAGSGMVMTQPGPGGEPVIEVSDQPIVNGSVIISRVVSSNPGWIVIYSQVNGQPGDPIGQTVVQVGENKDVAVQIDPDKVTPILYALLHVDQGKVGTFEFPGPDNPVMIGVKMIQSTFNIVAEAQATQATPVGGDQLVLVSDQVIRGGTVRIDEVHSKGPGWVGIHIQEPNGTVGPPIGDAHVDDGVTKNLMVTINAKIATGVMYAMLHYDRGKPHIWEFPDPDAPVVGDMNLVMPAFKITGGLPKETMVIKLGQSNGSPILVDGSGLTLYTSLDDAPGKSNCDADCRLLWLPLIVTGKLSADTGVTVGKLGLITLPDGSRQATYGGYPLYYFYADIQPGDIGGQGLDGAWFTSPP